MKSELSINLRLPLNEDEDVYNFCYNILSTYELGLELEEEDKIFIETVLDEMFIY